MRVIAKWLGFALVAGSLAVLPFAIWVSTSWGFVSGALGLLGCALLGIALPRQPSPDRAPHE
ncbi:MAG TPA: hypothetical protein VN675_04965 [Burkholderiales bacterium]|nr:hypothetical protein [Burkholderiales bacterium]